MNYARCIKLIFSLLLCLQVNKVKAQEINRSGIDEGEATLLRKVEELTLHLIKLDQENKSLRQRFEAIDSPSLKPKE